MRFAFWPGCIVTFLLLPLARAQDAGGPSATASGQAETAIFVLDSNCSDMHACLKVKPIHGTLCDAMDSLAVNVTNRCKEPVAVGVCIEQLDHTWDCASHQRLGVGQTNQKSFVSCHSTGNFHVLSALAWQQAKQQCFSATPAPTAQIEEAPATKLPMTVCERARACCDALASLPEADAIVSSCGALNTVSDESGLPACTQLLEAMHDEATYLSDMPEICR